MKGIQKALSVYTWSLAKGRYGVELIFPMGVTMLCDVFNIACFADFGFAAAGAVEHGAQVE